MNVNTSVTLAPEQMVNLKRYPIADPHSEAAKAFAARCNKEFAETGLCMLPDFTNEDALTLLADEANGFAKDAFFCKNTHNAYLTEDVGELPEDDIERRQEQTFVGSVAYDVIPGDSRLRALYQWDPLMEFIGSVLGKRSFYRFADPLGACSINVFVDGGEHGWHFDESEFTVTLMLQKPNVGGAFEYVPKIRGRDDEREIVRNVLEGDRDQVFELPFTAGTLLIFGGKETIHRVTRVEGDKPRLVPVLCYSEQAGLMNSESVRKLFWGRTGTEMEGRA